ncbi:MAG: hypothetical protein ACK4YP_25525, partial [Myxococcota bacterium]
MELSARSPGALRSLCDRWAEALAGRDVDVADVAWTAASRRRGPARRAVVAATVEELRAGLVAEGDEPGGTLPARGRIVDLPIAAWGGETWAASAAPKVDAVTTRPPGTRLETLLADLLPAALDAPDVALGDLGLDSLGALVLAGAVPTVPAATLRTLPYRALREVHGGTAGVAPVPTVAPMAAPEPRPSLALPDVRLERIRDGQGVPLVIVHPGAGEAWEGVDLGDRPVWLARSWALEAGEGASIVPFGVAFAAAVGALFQGPVAWCGWSIGGTIAWEAAARREAAGGEAPLVVLLDTYGPGVTMPADLAPLARAWSAASGSAAVEAWRTGLEASARRVSGWSPPSRRGSTLRVHATERAGVPVGWETGAEVWVEADHYSLVRGDALRR